MQAATTIRPRRLQRWQRKRQSARLLRSAPLPAGGHREHKHIAAVLEANEQKRSTRRMYGEETRLELCIRLANGATIWRHFRRRRLVTNILEQPALDVWKLAASRCDERSNAHSNRDRSGDSEIQMARSSSSASDCAVQAAGTLSAVVECSDIAITTGSAASRLISGPYDHGVQLRRWCGRLRPLCWRLCSLHLVLRQLAMCAAHFPSGPNLCDCASVTKNAKAVSTLLPDVHLPSLLHVGRFPF